jgi:predicted  nucleic acid-binding Zn ribbon protein
MILANVIFGTRRRNEPAQLEDVAESYLGALYHSGQLCGEYFLTWTKRRLNAHVLLASRAAMEPRHHSQYGRKELKKVIKAFGAGPVWRILDDDASQPPSSWRDAPFLYLFTHAFDWAPPVCRGDGKPPIPVFMLPVTFEQKEQLYFWQRSYYHHDNIWLGSGALEIGAYRQLASPDSELAQHGRDLCREIETATGVPTFYYLTRYWGRAKGEEHRLCPGCGAAWRAERPLELPGRFWQFDFKCDRCRLVSHLGVSTDGGRHTRIGEFDERGKTNKTAKRTGASRSARGKNRTSSAAGSRR